MADENEEMVDKVLVVYCRRLDKINKLNPNIENIYKNMYKKYNYATNDFSQVTEN